jgi:formylglycine-generating enzyme required for sulfatase activity
VLRGGSWFNIPGYLRSAYRYGHGQEWRNYGVGFRVAQDV